MEDKDIQKLNEGRGEFNYKGNLVRRLLGGWEIRGIQCTTPEQVEEAIEHSCSILEESIVNPSLTKTFKNKGDWDTSNGGEK